MAVTVLIKRKVSVGKGELLKELYGEMIELAVTQKGYIGAKTFRRVDVKDDYLVISEWEQVEDWSRWLVSEGRRAYQERIDDLTDENTKFEIYE